MLVTVGRGDLTPPRNVVLRFSTGFMLEEFYHAERSRGLRGGAARNRPGNRYSGQRSRCAVTRRFPSAARPTFSFCPRREKELIGALDVLRAQGVPMLLLGNGSNILVSDEGVRGAVVCTADVDEVRVGEDDNTLTAEAGALLKPHRTPGAAGRPYRRGVRGRHSGQPRRRGFHERRRV